MNKCFVALLLCACVAFAGIGIQGGVAFPQIGEETETVMFVGSFFEGKKFVTYDVGVEYWKWSERTDHLYGEMQAFSFPFAIGYGFGDKIKIKGSAGFDIVNMMQTKLSLQNVVEREATEWNWFGGYHFTAGLWYPLGEAFEAGLIGKMNWQHFGSEEIDADVNTWSLGLALMLL